MNLNKWFDHGISQEQYIDSLDKHRESFSHIYENFTIPSGDYLLFENKESIRTIVLAEPWCGHCMLNIPILLRMTERAQMPIRFLPRDENLELMDNYLTNEKRFIPIFIFIDQEGNEVSRWGPMAPEVFEYVEEGKKSLPPKDSPYYEEAFDSYINEIGQKFHSDPILWNNVYEDIKKSLVESIS